MTNVNIINRRDSKSLGRQITELGITGMIWGLWLFLFMPLLNLLMWIVGLSTISTELFEKGGYLQFFELVQQMGLVILVTFIIMRLWGIYNFYRFGRHERRNHEVPDSMEKLSNFYQLTPQDLVHLETRKEVIWPHKDDHENPEVWLQEKSEQLTSEQINEDKGNIVMRFHDVREKSIPSITKSALISLTFVMLLAGAILFAVGGFQQQEDISSPANQMLTSEPSISETTNPEPSTVIPEVTTLETAVPESAFTEPVVPEAAVAK